ncbi:PHP domain-containing protein [Proteiniphilum saccharofermentans]|nr:PHP domain-containing protein [Proteiniphilum saccharofermentans]
MVKVNVHMHTPYSFSAFSDVDDALDRAVAEEVKVVGINDFYTTEGYPEWADGCHKRQLYPLFGIEFISLNEEDQKAGLRVNDPANPGRTYLSGKGLSHPFRLEEPYATILSDVRDEANRQVEAMCGKLNELLRRKNCDFELDLKQITDELTKGQVRERHLAKALRISVYDACDNDETRIKELLELLFDGKTLKSSVDNHAAVENEIRGNLLKAGGAAFVPEEATAFLPMETVQKIIIAAGGIPTYPFLADDANGNYTDFENDLERVAKQLAERGFHSVEFITTRNDVRLLEKYADYLYEQGFVVTFGSEHNTPAMEPIELFTRGGAPLTERLMEINYKGACVIAAHQHLVKQGLNGYIDEDGNADRSKRHELEVLGERLIASSGSPQNI